MSNTATKLTYLNTTKQKIKDGLNNLGAGLTDNDTFRSYANVLADIYDELPKVTGSGTDLELTPTKKGKLAITPKGNSSQFSTTGKNLLNVNSNLEFTRIRTIQVNIPAGTYHITNINAVASDGANRVSIRFNNNNRAFLISNLRDQTVTLSTDETTVYLYSHTDYPSSAGVSATIEDLMISVDGGAYEPYTDGPAPNPSYPYPVKTVTGENKLYIHGSNLIGLDTNQCPVDLKAGDKITITNNSTGTLNLNFYTNYGDETRNDNWSVQAGVTRTVTVGYDSKAIAWSSAPSGGLAWVNKGLTSLSYESQQIYQLSLGDIELCKIGDYQDYIYKSGDNWYKRELVGKLILSSELSWVKSSSTEVDRFSFNTTLYKNYSGSLCSHFIKSGVVTTIGRWFNNSGVQLGFNYSAYGTTTLQQWLNWLDNNNVTLYQPLTTPQDIPITDTTLISQLNDIYENAQSYNGTTNITSTYVTGNEQMVIDASALKSWDDSNE